MAAPEHRNPPATPPADTPGPAPERRRSPSGEGSRWRSVDLFGGLAEIEIEHGAAVYRLRRTSLGKLILTK